MSVCFICRKLVVRVAECGCCCCVVACVDDCISERDCAFIACFKTDCPNCWVVCLSVIGEVSTAVTKRDTLRRNFNVILGQIFGKGDVVVGFVKVDDVEPIVACILNVCQASFDRNELIEVVELSNRHGDNGVHTAEELVW